ncbi:MAG: hypothetical protein AB8B91_16505 [Rubripirellula sp.]
MRWLGHILLWAGFLAGAFASLANLENEQDKWATIPWLWYSIAMAVGVVGIVLLRRAKHEIESDQSQTEAEYTIARQSLDEVAAIVERMAQQDSYVPSLVLEAIDHECAEPFAEFANSRQAMVKRFGLDVYADVMTEFASAERYVNRSWSAAADGYVDEVASSLTRANLHLQNAKILLQDAEKAA